jgi:dTDP-4-amino-4,6-dideoxygalactose transaminase
MPDILAALGRVQLSRANELLRMRENISSRYDAAFSVDEHFLVPQTGLGDARHLYPLRLNLNSLRISRNDFIKRLQEKGIGVSVHFIPLHSMPYFKNRYRISEEDLPCSMDTFKRVISLPLWPGMTDEQINRVIGAVREIAEEHTA